MMSTRSPIRSVCSKATDPRQSILFPAARRYRQTRHQSFLPANRPCCRSGDPAEDPRPVQLSLRFHHPVPVPAIGMRGYWSASAHRLDRTAQTSRSHSRAATNRWLPLTMHNRHQYRQYAFRSFLRVQPVSTVLYRRPNLQRPVSTCRWQQALLRRDDGDTPARRAVTDSAQNRWKNI